MAITLANNISYFGVNVLYQFVDSLLFLWILLVAVLGLTFLFSSLFKSSSSSSIFVTAILFLFAFTIRPSSRIS